MLSDSLYQIVVSDKSVTSELAQNPNESPEQIKKTLYGKHEHEAMGVNMKPPNDEKGEQADLQQAFEAGKWGGQRPSDLFLKCYYDSLCSLEKQPLAGMVSPSLMGSSGVVPLTIISTLPDINRHTANCIVRAEKEVLLATNFWIHSDASMIITNALRELSKRAGERGEKVVVKVIYDRGSLKQVYENHQHVSPSEYSSEKLQLPAPEDVPNLHMEVINYHRPLLGTFHAKFVVIDRKIGLLQSNNVQDNDNLEMMQHVEGSIVDSLYDTFIISWDKHFDPPLPLTGSPAAKRPIPSHETSSIAGEEALESTDIYFAKGQMVVLPESTTAHPYYDVNLLEEARRVNSQLNPGQMVSRREATTYHLSKRVLGDNGEPQRSSIQPDGPDILEDNQMTPYIVLPKHEPVPMAMVSREPNGTPGNTNYPVPQNASWLAGINNAERTIFIQTPNMNAEPLLEPLLNAVRRGVVVTAYVTLGYNDSGELLPGQNGTNEMIAYRLYSSLSSEEKSRLKIYNYVAKDRKTPVHNKFKYRSSHVKLMIVDETVAIQGNGNLDTQSFFHSTEINILTDSPLICKIWREAIERNQNTAQYGLVSTEDGCWHHPETGSIAEGTVGPNPGKFSWARGIIGAVQRVRGAGGF